MDIEGGGWARYGRSNKGTVWNYVDEDATEITLDIISPSEVKEMIDLKYNNFLVQTDVVFKMQADDSVNPSRLTTRSLPWLVDTPLFIPNYGNDHTRIEFPSGSGKCFHRVVYNQNIFIMLSVAWPHSINPLAIQKIHVFATSPF